MPKRKRDENDDHESEDRAQKIRKNRLRAKIEQGNKSIASALKLARGFERQKLGRRQKTAKDDPKALPRLNEEVSALKALDLGKTAEKYLFKQLAKTKRIKESSTFVALYGENPAVEAPKSGAEANVVGRLFNSNPIKQVMPTIMKGILGCLGLDIVAVSGKVKQNEVLESSTKKTASLRSGRSEGDEFEGFSAEDDPADLLPRNLETAADDTEDSQDEEMAAYADRLASDSSADAESVSSDVIQIPFNGLNGTKRHTTESDNISLSPSPQPPSIPKSSGKAAKAAAKPSGTTTFLPSLMMGGYYSGSESEDFGDEPLKPGQHPLQKKERKNRRGQRARQEIAEKKYGKNANHLKKEAAKKRSRDAGWDPRKGATEGRSGGLRGRRGGFGDRMGRRIGKKTTGANSESVVGMREFGAGGGELGTKTKDGPLHPSWEAAKKRKEQSLGTTQAFGGKKVTFD
jgi:BUD22